jgi:hypothetical protein
MNKTMLIMLKRSMVAIRFARSFFVHFYPSGFKGLFISLKIHSVKIINSGSASNDSVILVFFSSSKASFLYLRVSRHLSEKSHF